MIGEYVGNYKLVEFIARGEVSFVYKAHGPELEDFFAVKIFRLSPTRDEKMLQDLLLEAERTSRLIHPHILPVFDSGIENGVYYTVTRYVNASSLDQIMDEFRHPRHALTLMRPLSSALDYLHRKNIIHGNVKPNNVLVDANTNPYLTSIGFASRLSGATTYGAYAAPEQALGILDQRVDVYAMGVLMYEMLTSKLPSPGRPVSVRKYQPRLPEEVDRILKKAMEKEPEKRFGSCMELTSALEAVIFPEGMASDTAPAPVLKPREGKSWQPSIFQRYPDEEISKRNQRIRFFSVLSMLLLSIGIIIYLISALIGGTGIYSEPSVVTVNARIDANVRSGPGIDYPIIAILKEGESTIATGTDPGGNWYAIYLETEGNTQAWISAGVVDVDRRVELPIIEPSRSNNESRLESAAIRMPRDPCLLTCLDWDTIW